MRIAFGYTCAMSMVKEIRLRLPQDEYDRLIAEAERQGVSPDALARTYLHERLSVDAPASKERQAGIRALEELQALRQRLPAADPIDVVELIRQGRDDLSRRTVG